MGRAIVRTIGIVLALLAGTVALTAGPAAGQESTPTGTPAAVVGETQVTWTGMWEYDAESSWDEQVTLTQANLADGTFQLAIYGTYADAPVEQADDAIDLFTEELTGALGPGSASEIGSGELDAGHWGLYSVELQGMPLTMLIAVSETTEGEYVVSALVANGDQFAEVLEQAQADILLNGEPTFLEGIDAEDVAALLGGTPAALESTPAS